MKKYFPIIIILIVGTLLRFYHNLNISLWHDEAFSALMIRYPWSEMFYRLGLDVHPPMYYIFLRFWHNVFGDSLLSLRGMSIFFGVGTIWAGWMFTKEAFKSEKAALWAALFIALNPFQLQYVTEARMYTMGAFFALLAGYFLVKAFYYHTGTYNSEKANMPNMPEDIKSKRLMWLNYLGFTLSMIVIIYTHYYLFFTAAALGFYGVLYLYFHHRGGWKKFIPLLSSFAVIIISFLPWLKTFLFQYRQVQGGYWISQMDRWSIPSTFWDMLLGFARDTSKGSTQNLLILVTLFSLFLFFRFLKKTQSFHKWLVAFAVVAPFAGAILFAILAKLKGSTSSVYLDRYFLFASVYYSIALAVWLKELSIKWLSISLFGIYIILNLIAYTHYWSELDVMTKPGMSSAGQFLKSNVASGDKLYIGSSFMFFNLKYYWTSTAANGGPYDQDTKYSFNNGARPLLFTGGEAHASNISHFAGSALLTDEDLLPDFKAATHSGDTVWMVWTNGFGASKPQAPLNWTQVDERNFAEVRPYVGTYVYVTEYKVN